MNFASLLSAPTTSASPAGASTIAQPNGSTTPGTFDALVTAKAAAVGGTVGPAAQLAVSTEGAGVAPVETVIPTTEVAPTGLAVLSAATMAMLSALDRSATMLSQPDCAKPAVATPSKDEKPVATDADTAVPSVQVAALISAFMAVGRAIPAVVPPSEDKASDTTAATPTSSTPKASPPLPTILQAVATPPPALFTAIANELRAVVDAKADHADAPAETVKDSPDGVSVVSPTSAMIRDLASMIANSANASSPADGVAVDRHLDLARGDAWLNDLANDIAATAANGGRLKFGLAPESLGRLDVEIRQGASGVNVHMTTRTDAARDVLTAAQPRIIDEIRAQGVRVAGTEVSTDASGFGGDRAGSTPRQPFALPIDVALSAPNAALSKTSEAVIDGRYA